MRVFLDSAKRIFVFTREDSIVFILAISLRILALSVLIILTPIKEFSFPVIGSDSRLHMAAAQGLIDYHRFIDIRTLLPLSYILPGYPLFLALATSLFSTIWIVPLTQIILAGLATVFLFRIGSSIHSIVGWIAALLFAVDPAGLYYTNVILTEPVFIPLAVFAWYLLVCFPHHPLIGWLLAGALVGIAILVRPAGVILIPGALIFLCVTHWPSLRRIFVACAVFSVGILFFLGPWIARNYIVFHQWDISPVASLQYYAAHAPLFYAWREGIPDKEAIRLFQRRLQAISPYSDKAITPNAPYMRRVAFEYINQHPIEFATFHAIKTIPLFLSDGMRELAERLNLAPPMMPNISNLLLAGNFSPLKNMIFSAPLFSFIFFLGLFSWMLIMFFLAIGAWRGISTKHAHRPLLIACVVVLLTGALVAGGATSHPRYRHSISPFIFLLASYGFFAVAYRLFSYSNRNTYLPVVPSGSQPERSA